MKASLKSSLTVLGIVAVLGMVLLGAAYVTATTLSSDETTPVSNPPIIYDADDLTIMGRTYNHTAVSVQPGTDLENTLFDGYPEIVKEESSQPVYDDVKVEKDVMVPMRDGVKLAVDIFRPNVEGKKFPAIVSWSAWGKEMQETFRWMPQQEYLTSPFCDLALEAGAIDYFVHRGYVRVNPEQRGIGNSEGELGVIGGTAGARVEDIYDTIEWIAKQPWCDGNVGMMGACGYSLSQVTIAKNPPKALKCITPFEAIVGSSEHFEGMFNTLTYNIVELGRHAGDHQMPGMPRINRREMEKLPPDKLKRMMETALNDPDMKYHPKFYALLKYPDLSAHTGWQLLQFYGGEPPAPLPPETFDKIKIPTYMSAPWRTQIYIWPALGLWRKIGTPEKNKKMMLWPAMYPPRPFKAYSDEELRWFDYWLKGKDTGIMDEPPIKMYLMGINKWRFEEAWPLPETQWTKFYLQPNGGLCDKPVSGAIAGTVKPDTFTQPAPYLDPTVYALTYTTDPFSEDVEITGHVALHLEAAISIDDTNWMVDLVDICPAGKKRLLSQGFLKAKYRALDEAMSKPYQPVHPRQAAVPVPPGEVVEYDIEMMSISNVFQKGHSMQLIIRNQDDLLSRVGLNGRYRLPFMRTVTHEIHLGNSHLLLPVIPYSCDCL